ncbi:beta-N-acetylhexosaminidase [Cellvibrio zantedeschiae]|uniref:beta-N-acetylhexosaminidase n=1 Tax=Cellvibrio zantedeschiae TaxID=1237077 RepID=A0ABQ3BC60_9GAMM|nr:family 20 glycosylhydrolase [Cellvibrio zantedeschiae]GGY83667.1 beta-N-acetylhexosaminidase [Cellvibrio zantedeschiae]
MKSTLGMALLCTSLVSAMSFAQAPKSLTQQELTQFGQKTELRLGVITNFGREGMQAHLVLNNHSSVALPAGEGNWRIYFHSVRNIHAKEVGGLRLKRINGDLNEIAPTKDFAGLAAGASLEFLYGSGEWAVSYTDFMPRAFIAQQDLTPVIFANTDTEDLPRFVDAFEKPEQQQRFGGNGKSDLYPVATAASRYQDNLALNQVNAKAQLIIPTPKSLKLGKGSIKLDNTWQIRYAGRLTQEALYLQQQLKAAGLSLDSQPDNVPATGNIILLGVDETANVQPKDSVKFSEESYQLSVDTNKITLNGADNTGTFYAIQSLLSLLPAGTANQFEIPKLSVADSPRFSWRGMHYDMGRNFHGKAVTLRLIEQMGRYKLNKLHLHLTEDEGWRIQIPGLPELTDVGGARCFDLTETQCVLTQLGTGPSKSGSGNGYYTREDFVEILKFAAARHIDVIPEIDMPGHARAAIKSMQARYKKLLAAGQKEAAEQYLLSDPADKSQYMSVQNYTDNAINVCLPSTYAFAEKVIYELQQMYRTAGLKLTTFHMGGDEVGKGAWEQSPACRALFAKGEKGVTGVADLKPYFVSKIADITHSRGLNLAGWEDGLMYDTTNTFNRKQFANDKVFANAWDNIWEWGVADRAYRLANAGYQVILSPGSHLYFDHPYEANSEERGYYWATRYSDTAKVFGFMPDNYYANADKTREGVPITNLEALIGRELPKLRKPENLAGIQGQLWSETVRTPEQLEQMIYPRVIALAERAWHKADWEADKPNTQARLQEWANFSAALVAKDLPKMAAAGSSFYLPPPGAIIQNGQLLVNTGYAGLGADYSLDQGATWQAYTAPVAVSIKSVQVRSRVGDHYSRVTKTE